MILADKVKSYRKYHLDKMWEVIQSISALKQLKLEMKKMLRLEQPVGLCCWRMWKDILMKTKYVLDFHIWEDQLNY